MIASSIEKLIRWCVVDEWPKEREASGRLAGERSGWLSESYVKLLTVIDENRYGVVPDVAGHGDVHPDAVVIGEALRRLCAGDGPALAEIDPAWLVGDIVWRIGERQGDEAARAALDWLLPRSLAALDRVVTVDAAAIMRAKAPMDALVVRSALLGAPEWRMPTATWGQIKRPNGTLVWRRKARRAIDWNEECDPIRWAEVEVDVPPTPGGRRRVADAYPAMAVMPFDAELVVDRARYVIWRTALRAIAAAVDGHLVDHTLIDDVAASMPWIGGERVGRVLAVSPQPSPMPMSCRATRSIGAAKRRRGHGSA